MTPPCKAPTAYQDQFGVQYLAKEHFDMQLGGAGIRTRSTHWATATQL